MTSPLPVPRRSASLPKISREESTAATRYKLYFEDDDLYLRFQRAAKQLLICAAQESTTTNARLTKKALQYRKVFDRLDGVDVTTPEFDASSFLGVEWCKTTCLKTHCQRQQVTRHSHAP